MRFRRPIRIFNNLFIRRSFAEAQLIVTRRCNLSCGYCNEYDDVSKSIPVPLLRERIDALHRLGVVQIALLGGEPLMHKEIDEVVAHAGRASRVSITTNGVLLGKEIVHRLNDAGLDHMQVSIDTLRPTPDLYIQKSMKTIQSKLEMLLGLAHFSVNTNIVLCEASKADFKEMIAELRRLQVNVTVGLLHDHRGAVAISGEDYVDLWDHHYRESKVVSHIEYEYGKQLLRGERTDWLCRAGSRHIYIDEFGNAQLCASQRGRLNKPIVEYTRDDIRRHSREPKGCEHGCTVFCVYRASQLDNNPVGVARSLLKSFRDRTVSIRIRNPDGRKAAAVHHDRETRPA